MSEKFICINNPIMSCNADGSNEEVVEQMPEIINIELIKHIYFNRSIYGNQLTIEYYNPKAEKMFVISETFENNEKCWRRFRDLGKALIETPNVSVYSKKFYESGFRIDIDTEGD